MALRVKIGMQCFWIHPAQVQIGYIAHRGNRERDIHLHCCGLVSACSAAQCADPAGPSVAIVILGVETLFCGRLQDRNHLQSLRSWFSATRPLKLVIASVVEFFDVFLIIREILPLQVGEAAAVHNRAQILLALRA